MIMNQVTVAAHSTKQSVDSPDTHRRGLLSTLSNLGSGVLSAGIFTSLAAGGLIASVTPAAAAVTDQDIFNFALNFEYLGAEFYLRAVTGQGLDATDVTGTGTQGTVTGGSQVPFQSTAIASYAQRLAVDELAHVRFVRAVLGGSAVAEPSINLADSWTTLASAAGLIVPGQTFSPFTGDVAFLLGAYIIEDVCVTALAGSARYIADPDYLEAAAGLLGTEGYQAGMIRSLLSDLGAGSATNAISALRSKLSGAPDDFGTTIPGNAYNFVPNDINSLAFRRTPAQVLNIAYGGGAASNFGFFPNRVNGTIN